MNKQTTSPSHSAVSVVVIGRNEGARLVRCLQSVQQAHWGDTPFELIYVDSRSTDDSLASARALGFQTLELNDANPCAAKARNLGWQAARGEFILFLDGDTELHADFVQHALHALRDPKLCAAWGHRRESAPQQSVYTAVLDLDWIYPIGRSIYFGGDVLVRRAALAEVNGFDPTLKAGEEPEMCARLRARKWEIEHLDVAMTRHDLAVRTLRAYWLRCYRSGIAYAEVAHRMQRLGDGLWQKESARDFWHGVLYAGFPLMLVLAFVTVPALGAGLLAAAVGVIVRTAWRSRSKAAGNAGLSLQYAIHSHLQKLPALAGQLAWKKAHASAQSLALVDYKQ